MPFRLTQRLAVVATGLFFLVAASGFSLPARADDPPQTAHESAVLDRIFANWKGRQDRFHSIHVTWNRRDTHSKGSRDPSSIAPSRHDRDQEFDQFGLQLWIDGDERLCYVYTPTFKVPQAKLVDTGREVGRWVWVGKTTSGLFSGWPWETGAPPPSFLKPSGNLHRIPTAGQGMVGSPLLLTFRPQHPSIAWRKDQCRLVGENAIVDGGHYLKIQRVFENRNVTKRQEACWVDPARDDVVVHWQVRQYAVNSSSIKYQKDKVYGWIPSE